MHKIVKLLKSRLDRRCEKTHQNLNRIVSLHEKVDVLQNKMDDLVCQTYENLSESETSPELPMAYFDLHAEKEECLKTVGECLLNVLKGPVE